MFKFKIIQTTRGVKKEKRNLTSGFEAEKAIKKSLRAARKINASYHLSNILEEIRQNLLQDRLNDFPESRSSENKQSHYITGDLYRSVGFRVTGSTKDEININFGYFINYGENLELGGPINPEVLKRKLKAQADKMKDISMMDFDFEEESRAYPIISVLWERKKHTIVEDITDDILMKFRNEFEV